MKSPDYVAKRLARLAAEIRVEMGRPTLRNHPNAGRIVGLHLWRAHNDLDAAAEQLSREYSAPAETPAAPVSEGDSGPVRFAFIATGRDGFAGPICYAQDAEGTVWTVGDAAIETAHRFATQADADRIGSTRGGYAYPIPAA